MRSINKGFSLEAAEALDSREVRADVAGRDAIPAGHRYRGMVVFVESNSTAYRLKTGITNGDWVVADPPAKTWCDYYEPSVAITAPGGVNTLAIDCGNANIVWATNASGFLQVGISTLYISLSSSGNARSLKLFIRVTVTSTMITFPPIYHTFDTDSTESIYKNATDVIVFKTGFYEIGMDKPAGGTLWSMKATKVAQ